MLRENEAELIVPELDKALAKQWASGILRKEPESTKKKKKDQCHGSWPLDTNEANLHHKLVNQVDFPTCLFSQIVIILSAAWAGAQSPYCFDIALESFQAASWSSPWVPSSSLLLKFTYIYRQPVSYL